MPSLLLKNARIWTSDPALPWAECALIEAGRFVFVGRETELSLPGNARMVDAGGKLVLPGFTDAHIHLLGTGEAIRSVDLKDVPSEEEATQRVAERVASTTAGGWIRGAGWDQHPWQDGRFPTKASLDVVAPEHPVVLVHTSGHCIWVNSMALRAAGIRRETPPPAGGAIDLDRDGEPSGVLRDAASRLVTDAMPRPSNQERQASIRQAVQQALRLGLTGVHAMDAGAGELAALRALHERGELPLRTRVYLSARRLNDWIDGGLRTGDGDDVLSIGGVKFFADGALGSLTAWMLEPYEDTDDRGLLLQTIEELEEQVKSSLNAGLSTAIHAIGDRANRQVLGMLERLRSIEPDLPRRIEHGQLLTPEDVPRFAQLRVTASMQPIHATQDMAKVDRHWGDRGRHAYPIASVLATGANVAFGSDSPVETMDPIAGLHAAITRRNARGEPEDGWYPNERVSLDDALRAYTNGSARAAGTGTVTGRIAEGCCGDFIILSHDLFRMDDPMEILESRVERTVMDGEAVHTAG